MEDTVVSIVLAGVMPSIAGVLTTAGLNFFFQFFFCWSFTVINILKNFNRQKRVKPNVHVKYTEA